MTKKDFITKLRRALAGKIDSTKIAEHASYYEEYIEIRVRKGNEERQVTEELGDPALLAKSILNAEQDRGSRFNETKFFALGMHVKSVCLNLSRKVRQKAKNWFDNLQ